LGGHVCDVAGDIERFMGDGSVRWIIRSSGPSPGAAPSGSPLFSTYPSWETRILNHTTTPSRSSE
jgi:hypothetical protein